MWREDFTVSQFYAAVWWGRRDFTVSGKSETGVKRKKKFQNLQVPVGITILDPLKVVPVGNLMFNKDQLAYCANNTHEYDLIRAVIDGVKDPDPMIKQLMVAPYMPDEVERRVLAARPATVWIWRQLAVEERS